MSSQSQSQSQAPPQLNSTGQKPPETPLHDQLGAINKQIDRIEQDITTLENRLSVVLIGTSSPPGERPSDPIEEGHSDLHDRLESVIANLADLAFLLELIVDRVEL